MVDSSFVSVLGTGSSVPCRVVRNADLPLELDADDDWIRTRTGIAERRFAGPHDTAASLGTSAAIKAMEAAGCKPSDIDLIICGTITPDFVVPATACLIQGSLGCRHVPAFDITAACSAFPYAISIAERFIRTGGVEKALVIGTDILTRVVDFQDRNTAILFGDGAGAVVLGPSVRPGIHHIRLYADGSRGGLILVPSRVSDSRPEYAGVPLDKTFLQMHGREVFRFAVLKVAEMIRQAQDDCRELGKELDLVVPHQVNIRIIDAAWELVRDLPRDRVMLNLERYGNTSAASVAIALDEAIRTERARTGDTILMIAFGGGVTWSSVLMTL